jgi:arsenite methyltransferase
MTGTTQDQWAQWLLHRRFGGDLQHGQAMLQALDRCRFVRAPADDLAALAPGSVDVVTTRSVLIYVQAKQQALHEFFRVLRPGGRLSLFEPINRLCYPEPPHQFLGYDVTPIEEIAGKVRAVFERIHEPASSPLLNFDERDLLAFAERAGFAEIHLELQATIKQPKPLDSDNETSRPSWETLLKSSGNPPSSHAGRGHGAGALPSRSRTLHRVSAPPGRDGAGV